MDGCRFHFSQRHGEAEDMRATHRHNRIEPIDVLLERSCAGMFEELNRGEVFGKKVDGSSVK